MKSILKAIILIILFVPIGCDNETNIRFYLDTINSGKYYSEEIIPNDYQKIYGQWKLYKISGGIHGTGYDPDFDYLEIKNIGIYGIIRNDSVLEYGKIEPDTFDINTDNFLQLKFIPDYINEQNHRMYTPGIYIDLNGNDSLNILSPCCDLYDYHFKRIK